MLPQPFAIVRQAAETPGSVRLSVQGDVDLYTAPRLRSALGKEKRASTAVHLDLDGVSFMDSSGLQVLVQVLADAAADGWQLQVDKASEAVRTLLRRTGLSDLLRV